MMPIDAGTKLSPWMLPQTRPIVDGIYECRFRGLDAPLRLWWNGRNFQAGYTDSRAVQMATFLTWRGEWA